jgi:hypothetical protein
VRILPTGISRFEALNLDQCGLEHSVGTVSDALSVSLSSPNEERAGVRSLINLSISQPNLAFQKTLELQTLAKPGSW